MPVLAQRSRLRLVPAPQTDPPYDDEEPATQDWRRPRSSAGAQRVGVQGTLALAFHVGRGVPAVPVPPRPLAGTARAAPGAGRAEARRWAAMLVQGVVEALTGDRPLSQLSRWTTLEVYEQLQWQCGRTRGSAALRAERTKARVSSVHVFEPTASVAEVCATIRLTDRAQALALRMESHGEAWRCTAIAFG